MTKQASKLKADKKIITYIFFTSLNFSGYSTAKGKFIDSKLPGKQKKKIPLFILSTLAGAQRSH